MTTPNTPQTPPERLEAILIDRYGLDNGSDHTQLPPSAHEHSEAAQAILAVFKGLPAMQEEPYSDIERDYAIAYGGNFSDGNRKKWLNELRRQILAELEEMKHE
jgi:hypothetical protein